MNKIIYYFSLLLLAYFTNIQVLSAQYYESQISKVINEKGDSPSGTFSIVEDSQGFIWFGTVEGLFRYDGHNYKVFRHLENDTNSLSNNTIRALCIQNDKLWIGTQGGGLNCLDLKTELISRFIHKGDSSNEISGNNIWTLMLDSNNKIWIGLTGKGVDSYDPASNKFTNYDVMSKFNGRIYESTVRALYEDSEGLIWIGIGNLGLVCLNPTNGEQIQFSENKNNTQINNNLIQGISEDLNGNIWIGTFGGGINIYDKAKKLFTYILPEKSKEESLISNLIYGLSKNRHNDIWIATE